jgi:hypothetical protein
MERRGMDATGLVKRQVTGRCKHGNKTSDSKKCGGIHSLADEAFSF